MGERLDQAIGGRDRRGRRLALAIVAAWLAATGCGGHPAARIAAATLVAPVPGVEVALVVAEPTLTPLEVRPGEVGADPVIEAMLAPYAAGVADFQEPIAHSTTEMARPADKKGDCPLGNWMADVTREAAQRAIAAPVDLALMNGGGIRSTLPAGPINREAILKVMPFDNQIVVVELDGPDMLKVLENLGRYPRSFAVSNARIFHDGRPALVSATLGGQPFDPSRRYRVALSDFLADGGDGIGGLLKVGKRTDTGILVRDAMEAHVRALAAAGQPITPPAETTRYVNTSQGSTGS